MVITLNERKAEILKQIEELQSELLVVEAEIKKEEVHPVKPNVKYHIVFSKVLDLIIDNGKSMSVSTHKQSELSKILEGVDTMKVTYVKGQEFKRMKQLEKLGYSLKEVIYTGEQAYSNIVTVWTK